MLHLKRFTLVEEGETEIIYHFQLLYSVFN